MTEGLTILEVKGRLLRYLNLMVFFFSVKCKAILADKEAKDNGSRKGR